MIYLTHLIKIASILALFFFMWWFVTRKKEKEK